MDSRAFCPAGGWAESSAGWLGTGRRSPAAGATSAPGLSWTPAQGAHGELELLAERKEDGGGGDGNSFQRPGPSSGKSRGGLVLQLGFAPPPLPAQEADAAAGTRRGGTGEHGHGAMENHGHGHQLALTGSLQGSSRHPQGRASPPACPAPNHGANPPRAGVPPRPPKGDSPHGPWWRLEEEPRETRTAQGDTSHGELQQGCWWEGRVAGVGAGVLAAPAMAMLPTPAARCTGLQV